MLLNIIQKKGDPGQCDGRVTVYARIDIDPEDLLSIKHTFASMVHNGFLVAQGNFKDQYNFRDFLKSELGISLEDGLEEGLTQLVDRMEGLESTLDPQKLKERLENMDDLDDFIPTPAKIVPFHSEEEILRQDGDVFFSGTFKNIGNAVLSVQALPMLYQARYREQEVGRIRSEIETIITQIEHPDVPEQKQSTEETILKDFLPRLLYDRTDPHDFAAAEKALRGYLSGYPSGEDIDAFIAVVKDSGGPAAQNRELLELYARKIACVEKEDFAAAEEIVRRIEALRRGT
ncbi:MAG: hypothetical protein MUF22_02485 [Chitinispirillaceae bacterium]|jgi:hypothetical protein|nr:hypothetical protein [Chitinispirillaceae bacterium]